MTALIVSLVCTSLLALAFTTSSLHNEKLIAIQEEKKEVHKQRGAMLARLLCYFS